MLPGLGKILIFLGILSTLLGCLFFFSPQIPFLKYLGRLPGDISVKRENFQFYFPLGTSLLISLLLSVIFYLLSLWRR